jgi:tetratricopeptide (TPR) repeat protein
MGSCELAIFVFGWQDSQVHSYFDDFSDIHCPAEIQLGDPDSQGYRELLAKGSTSTTWGGGPGRGVEMTFSLEDDNYQVSSVRYLPSDIRIHVLQDAQIASDAKDYPLAIQLFDKAAHDTTLTNWPSDGVADDVPEKYQPAYALYRLFCLYLISGDGQKAQATYAELLSSYPEGTAGSEFIKIALKFKVEFKADKEPSVICNDLFDFVGQTSPDDFWLHWSWGYNNMGIWNLCPYSD